MRRTKSKAKFFKSERARQWATDFMIGIGMFTLVAFFASTHTKPALPAPLERTQAVIGHSTPFATTKYIQTLRSMQFVSSQDLISASVRHQQPNANNNILLIFMAMAFSALLTLTSQFWRNLRRAYASPRRKRGRG